MVQLQPGWNYTTIHDRWVRGWGWGLVGADLRGGLVTFLLSSPKKWAVHKWSMDAMLEFPDRNKRQKKSQAHTEQKTDRKKPCMSSMQDSPIKHLFKKIKKKWTVCEEWIVAFCCSTDTKKRRHEMRWRLVRQARNHPPDLAKKKYIKSKKMKNLFLGRYRLVRNL